MFEEHYIACVPDVTYWEYHPAIQAEIEYEDGHKETVPFLID